MDDQEIEATLEKLEEGLQGLIGTAERVSGAVQALTGRIGAVEAQLATAVDGYESAIAGMLGELDASIRSVSTDLADAVESEVDAYGSTVEKHAAELFEQFSEGSSQISAFRESVGTARQGLEETVGEFEAQVLGLTEYAAEQVAQELVAPVEELSVAVTAGLSELLESIAGELIEPAVAQLSGELTNLVDQGLAGAEKYVNDGVSAVINVLERSVEDMTGKNAVMKDLTAQLEPALQALAPVTDAVAAIADSVGVG